MHGVDVGSVLHGPCRALLRRHGRGRATEGRDSGLLRLVALGHGVVPLRVDELQAGPIATGDKAGVRVDGPQVQSGSARVLFGGTALEREACAINDAHLLKVVPYARAVDVELEWERVSIYEAYIHVVTACHGMGVRVAGGALLPEGGLELGVHRRRAARVVGVRAGPYDAALPRTAAATQAAIVTVLVARHLRPIPHRRQTVRCAKVVRRHRLDARVLGVRSDLSSSAFVRNPYRLIVTAVPDP
mmetsp:Transcript_29584/g.79902  ORF Transcript_29584/g.79902 Transcript_29584/m.79902 type:complete len:245 (+) Transcript_29584:648-1382(+)